VAREHHPPEDEAARHRGLETDQDPKSCGHHDAGREAAAEANSASVLERWEHADPATRTYLLDRVGREMMTVHEAPPPELEPKELAPELRGQYVDEAFRIDINRDLLKKADPKDGLETYLHEYRHAEQAYEVAKSRGSMAHDVNASRASLLAANDRHYIVPEESFEKYRQQISEADARQFSERTAKAILNNRVVPEK
jgi:hypothetical protein